MRLPSTLTLECELQDALRYSFRDYHVKGFDYLCLKRTDRETVKVYFFDGEVSQLPEVVMPHNHRYDFLSTVLAGQVRNRLFQEYDRDVYGADPYECFDYSTPLNGGGGFRWRYTTWLKPALDLQYEAGEAYAMRAPDIHTIQIMAAQTVLMLIQYEDKVPVGEPTWAYQPDGDRSAPDLSGLYNPMTEAYVQDRLALLAGLTGKTIKVFSE